MASKTISLGCGVPTSPMIFLYMLFRRFFLLYSSCWTVLEAAMESVEQAFSDDDGTHRTPSDVTNIGLQPGSESRMVFVNNSSSPPQVCLRPC